MKQWALIKKKLNIIYIDDRAVDHREYEQSSYHRPVQLFTHLSIITTFWNNRHIEFVFFFFKFSSVFVYRF